MTDHQLVGAIQGRLAHERLDVDPIAEVGRNAAGAGVRVAQQSQRLELGHGAAHGGRADREAVALDQRLRADRNGIQDVVLDDGAQHDALPLGQVQPDRDGAFFASRVIPSPTKLTSVVRCV